MSASRKFHLVLAGAAALALSSAAAPAMADSSDALPPPPNLAAPQPKPAPASGAPFYNPYVTVDAHASSTPPATRGPSVNHSYGSFQLNHGGTAQQSVKTPSLKAK